MNINEVYQLMDKFEASTLAELSLEMEGVKLTVKKACACGPVPPMPPHGGAFPPPQGAPMSGAPAVPVQAAPSPASAPVSTAPATEAVASKAIKAPLVGTFYRASAPGEKPFVEVGQQVKKGDVVGIIEAMKLMNEITATEDGVVEEIVVEDGSLVEYNEVLIRMS